MDENKKIVEVTVRVPESLKRDLQDEAAHQDRTLSDTIRIALSQDLYGVKTRPDHACGHAESCPTLRGDAL